MLKKCLEDAFGGDIAARVYALFLLFGLAFLFPIQTALSADLTTTALNSLPLDALLQQNGRPRTDLSCMGHPLMVNGTAYAHGIGLRANCVWKLSLDGNATSFTGLVGVDDGCGGKPVLQFTVEGDGQILWKSNPLMAHQAAQAFKIDLVGIKKITLWLTSRDDVANPAADLLEPAITHSGANPRPINTTWQESVGPAQPFWSWAPLPPMGWNSYDAFGASVTEAEFLANAVYQQKNLLPFGWNLCVVDYRWSDATAAQHSRNGNGGPLAMDQFGRLLPATNRFPSAADGHGFKALADRIHAMGLQFGIHVMRGIPRQAVAKNTPIEGSSFHAQDAANTHSTCGWCGDMWGIDGTTPAGQAYYDSIFRLYASWNVDFVKVDDISYPYSAAEIACVREAIDHSGRKMILSLSCGETPIAQETHVVRNANMWRVSSDFWDRWVSLNHSFDLAETWHGIGGPGHWPDFDMLPFGHIGIRCLDGESSPGDRRTRFTEDEQTTLMSLWCLEASPLIVGGNLPDLDPGTLALLTNREAIAIDQDQLGSPAVWAIKYSSGIELWRRDLADGSKAVGIFNRGDAASSVMVNLNDVGLAGTYSAQDVWQKKDLGVLPNEVEWSLPPHSSILLKMKRVP